MNIPSDIKEAAKLCAGNWREFTDFGWDNSDIDHVDDWFVYHLANRDSGIAAESNEHVFNEELLSFGDMYVRSERFSHWGVGWVNVLIIRVYEACGGEITEAFKKWHELSMALSEYPLLDESDYSQREYDVALEAIGNVAPIVTSVCPSWRQDVFRWLWDNDQRQLDNEDDHGGCPSEESVIKALDALGIEYER
jgi:hypothetical protein